MLGWLFWGILIGATVSIIIITVKYFDKKRAKEELRDRKINKATVRDIFKNQGISRIKLQGLDDDGNEVELQVDAEDYNSAEIKKGEVIYV